MRHLPSFWRRTCVDVLDSVAGEFEERMSENGLSAPDWLKFEMFHLITLNFAQMAYEQKAIRQFIGIRKGFFRGVSRFCR